MIDDIYIKEAVRIRKEYLENLSKVNVITDEYSKLLLDLEDVKNKLDNISEKHLENVSEKQLKEMLDEILKKTSPKFVHFMSYETKIMDEKEFLKTFSGMLKFTHNNKNGIFDIERSAAFLAQTESTIVELLNVFEECKIIKISEKTSTQYKIEYLLNAEISKTLHSNSYKSFLNKVKASEEFKQSILEAELSNFCN